MNETVPMVVVMGRGHTGGWTRLEPNEHQQRMLRSLLVAIADLPHFQIRLEPCP